MRAYSVRQVPAARCRSSRTPLLFLVINNKYKSPVQKIWDFKFISQHQQPLIPFLCLLSEFMLLFVKTRNVKGALEKHGGSVNDAPFPVQI